MIPNSRINSQSNLIEQIQQFLRSEQKKFKLKSIFQINVENFILTKFFYRPSLDSSDEYKPKKQITSINTVSILNEILKINCQLKYNFALFLSIALWHQQNKLNCMMSFYYEILNLFLKNKCKQHQEPPNPTKQIPYQPSNKPNNILSPQQEISIKKYISLSIFNFSEFLINPNTNYLIHMKVLNKNILSFNRLIKASKLIKILNSLFCFDEKLVSVKQIIKLFLSIKDLFAIQAKEQVFNKIQYKLTVKFSRYQYQQFQQAHLIQLFMLIIGDYKEKSAKIIEDFITNKNSHDKILKQQIYKFLQQISKKQQKRNVFGYHLTCYLIKNLNKNQKIKSQSIFKQKVFFICLKYLHVRFENRLKFYNQIIKCTIQQKNIQILKLCCNFIQNECSNNFSVQKLKSLFKLLAQISKRLQKISKKQINLNDEIQISKLKISRIIKIIQDLSIYFRHNHLQLIFTNKQNSQSIILMQKLNKSNSILFQLKINLNDLSQKNCIRIIKFKIGKSHDIYQVSIKIFQNNSSLDHVNNYNDLLNVNNQYSGEIIINKNQKCVIKQLLEKVYILHQNTLKFFISLSLSKQPAKTVKVSLSINQKLIEYQHNQKKNQLSYIQIGSFNGIIRNLFLFDKELPLQIYKLYEQYQFAINKLIKQQVGQQKITYKIKEKSELIFQQMKKNENYFFKTQAQIKTINIIKKKSLTFIDTFKQINGLNSIFYILQRVNKSYSIHFAEKTQYFFIQIFRVLKNIAANDKQNFIFSQVKSSYAYICHFIFLIFRKNQHLMNQRNSYFVDALFKFLLFFSPFFTKDSQLQYPNNDVLQMELIFVKEIVCNFETWSDCSCEIQSYIFGTLQKFIKSESHTFSLFSIDLHAKILSSVVFYYSSQLNPYKQKYQQQILNLCYHLYQKMLCVSQNQCLLQSMLKKISLKQFNHLIEKFIHRDANQCFSLIYSLINHNKRIDPTQLRICINLSNYFVRNFVQRTITFQKINQDWNYVLYIIQTLIYHHTYQIALTSKLLHIAFKIVQKQLKFYPWITQIIQKVTLSQHLTLWKLFQLTSQIIQINTRTKFNIFQMILKSLIKKISISSVQDIKKMFYHQNFETNLFKMVDVGLTTSLNLQNFINKMKQYIQIIQKQQTQSQTLIKIQQVNQQNQKIIKSQTFLLEKTKNQLLKTIYNFQDILFQICYQTSTINKYNIQWIANYFKFIYANQNKISILHGKRKNKQSQMKISVYSCQDSTFHFLYQIQQTVNQQLSQQIFEVKSGSNSAITLFISNPETSLQTLYKIYKKLPISIISPTQLTFIHCYISSNCFSYLLKKYSYSSQTESSIEKPIQALFRKSITLKALQILAGFFQHKYENYLWNLFPMLLNIDNNAFNLNSITKDQKKIKQIHQNLNFFINLWKNGDLSNKNKTTINQRDMFYSIIQKLKFICNLKQQEEQINETFKYFKQITQGSQSKTFYLIYNKIIMILKYYLSAKRYILLMQYSHLFDQQKCILKNQPKNQINIHPRQQLLTSNQGDLYKQTLVQKFNKLLQNERKKSLSSQKCWSQLCQQNQFWLEIQSQQQKDQIYQLDQKEVGPFGLYKLNIKPSQAKVEQINYPRKKLFSSVKSESTDQPDENDSFLSRSRIHDFSQIQERRRNTLLQYKTIHKNFKDHMLNNSFYCQYVTKKGVYAGKLLIKQNYLQFKYISHFSLPEGLVYKLSTGKFHQINELTDEQRHRFQKLHIPYKKCQVFTRRYILRHTGIQLFQKIDHKSYFFNLFSLQQRARFLSQSRNLFKVCIQNRKNQFHLKQYTQQWRTGVLSNFEYIGLVNKYSGRSTNDLAQYYVYPWVVANYSGKQGYNQINSDFLSDKRNVRDLTCPPGKLSHEKFTKLKDRLKQLDFCQPQDRFLYGTMFSNPTVLYNFFIRIQPYIQLHWQHQGKRIDHADRLFSGIEQQYNSVLTASSDMKQLCPQFYYWPQFLKNRSFIDLGKKQNKQQVNDVNLPIWARTPEQFIFKMRYVLESNQVSQLLHQWIDLTFGYKVKYQNAQQNDNLYHINCYQRQEDYFQSNDQKQIRSLQVSISQFGQVPQALFDSPHPAKNIRSQFMSIDRFLPIKTNHKQKKLQNFGFETCKQGIFIWSNKQVQFKKSYINQNYSSNEQTRVFASQGRLCRLLSFQSMSWVSLKDGILRVFVKKLLKFQKFIQTETLQIIGPYFIYSKQSQIYIDQYDYNKATLNCVTTLFGHKDDILLVKCSKNLDVLLTLDLEGFVMLHQLSNLTFLRNFQLPLQQEWSKNITTSIDQRTKVLKVLIHEMGYFIFLLNQTKLIIFTFLGELYLEQDLQISRQKKESQEISEMQIFSHDRSILLLSTNLGSIYSMDFIQLHNYANCYPFKTYTRIQSNILKQTNQWYKLNDQLNNKNQTNKLNKEIVGLTVEKIPGGNIGLFQLIVQYQHGAISWKPVKAKLEAQANWTLFLILLPTHYQNPNILQIKPTLNIIKLTNILISNNIDLSTKFI